MTEDINKLPVTKWQIALGITFFLIGLILVILEYYNYSSLKSSFDFFMKNGGYRAKSNPIFWAQLTPLILFIFSYKLLKDNVSNSEYSKIKHIITWAAIIILFPILLIIIMARFHITCFIC